MGTGGSFPAKYFPPLPFSLSWIISFGVCVCADNECIYIYAFFPLSFPFFFFGWPLREVRPPFCRPAGILSFFLRTGDTVQVISTF